MKELKAILSKYNEIKHSCNRLIIATVVNVEGSSYRRAGARMLIMEKGDWIGGVSGGCLEGDLLKKANLVYTNNSPLLIKYDTTENDPYQIGVGLGCKGVIEILLSPINVQDKNNILELLTGYLDSRQKRAVIHFVDCDDKSLKIPSYIAYENETSLSSLSFNTAVKESLIQEIVLRTEKLESGLFIHSIGSNTALKVFVEILPPNMLIYICGHEYDTIPLLEICNNLAWDIRLVCNPSKINKYQHQLANSTVDINEPELNFNEADSFSSLICMSHHYKTDLEMLSKALHSNISYIGILGPKDRGLQMIEDIKQANRPIKECQFNNIYYPTGLDIGAKQPEEIAISIIAEIIAIREKRNGGMLTYRKTPIHTRS